MADLSPLRRASLRAIARYVPSAYGDPAFSEMINGSWAPGFGTTCGYLISAVLYLLGCRDLRLVNRAEPSAGLTYKAGANMSLPVSGAKAAGAYRTRGTPRPGDPYFVFVDPPIIRADGSKDYKNHMGFVVDVSADGSTWHTADAGQGSAAAQFSDYRDRPYRAEPSPMLEISGQWRHVHFIDLEALTFAAPPAEPIGAGALAVGPEASSADPPRVTRGLGALVLFGLALLAGLRLWK